MSTIVCLRILRWILLFAGSLGVMLPVYSQSISLDAFITYDDELQKIRWKGVSELDYGIFIGPNQSTPVAPFAIGFSHLGYSEADPDGKAATLTLAVVTGTRIKDSGDGSIAVVELVPSMLDVSLQINPAEESRLRTLLNFPVAIRTADSVLPLQIRWTSTPGADLHTWLLDDRGLKLQMSGVIRTRLTLIRTDRIEPRCLDAWWSKTMPAQNGLRQELVWLATTDLARAGCFQMLIASRTAKVLTAEYEKSFLGKLRALGGSHVSLDQIKQAGLPLRTISATIIEIPFVIHFSPGNFLRLHPEYVKDLSGNSVGIDGLLGTE